MDLMRRLIRSQAKVRRQSQATLVRPLLEADLNHHARFDQAVSVEDRELAVAEADPLALTQRRGGSIHACPTHAPGSSSPGGHSLILKPELDAPPG